MTNHRHHLFAALFFAVVVTGWAVAMFLLSLQDQPIHKETKKIVAIFPHASSEQAIQRLKLVGARLIDDVGGKLGFHGKAWLVYADTPGLREQLKAHGALTLSPQSITLPGTGGCLPFPHNETMTM